MLVLDWRCYDYGGRRDHYRSGLNHYHCRRCRWGVADGLTAMTFRAFFDAVGLSAGNYYASKQDCCAKRQCGGFHSIFHDDHNSFVGFGSA